MWNLLGLTIASFLSASASLDLVEECKQGHALADLCQLDLARLDTGSGCSDGIVGVFRKI